MSKNGIRVEEFNIFALGGEAVSYHLKNIHTVALQVTGERIGGIALELGVELRYNVEDPYLVLRVARGPKEDPEFDRELHIRPGDWLVILWDEIHKFRDPEFRSTFSFDNAALVKEVEARFHEDVKLSEQLLRSGGSENPYGIQGNLADGAVSIETSERPPWIPNDAVPMVEVATGKLAWVTPDVYEELRDDVKKLYRPYGTDSEKTQIVPSVGELDTDESNGKSD